jgi:hypothetical protein
MELLWVSFLLLYNNGVQLNALDLLKLSAVYLLPRNVFLILTILEVGHTCSPKMRSRTSIGGSCL